MLEKKESIKWWTCFKCSMITIESDNIFFTNKMSFLWGNCENKVKPHVNDMLEK